MIFALVLLPAVADTLGGGSDGDEDGLRARFRSLHLTRLRAR